MRLCNAIPARLLAKNKCKRYNTLNTSNLSRGGGTQQVIYLTYLHTACSDATRRHLMDVLCCVGRNQTIQNSHVENVGSNNGFDERHNAW